MYVKWFEIHRGIGISNLIFRVVTVVKIKQSNIFRKSALRRSFKRNKMYTTEANLYIIQYIQYNRVIRNKPPMKTCAYLISDFKPIQLVSDSLHYSTCNMYSEYKNFIHANVIPWFYGCKNNKIWKNLLLNWYKTECWIF